MGEGDLVGDTGTGEGEGVRARGDRGMCPIDFLLLGEWSVLVFTWSLCLRPCSEDGLVEGETAAGPPGEPGSESAGLHEDEHESECPESDMVTEWELFAEVTIDASGEGGLGCDDCLNPIPM
jgi:hypothetical protein